MDEFEIRPDPTTHHRVSCPYVSEKLKFPFFLALYNGSQVSIVALWATCFDDLCLNGILISSFVILCRDSIITLDSEAKVSSLY